MPFQDSATVIYLRKPEASDLEYIALAYERSKAIHEPWTYAPKDFTAYLCQEYRYFVCLTDGDAIVGTFNISNIVRGAFHSAYLGYEAFSPHHGKGYMRQGMKLLLAEAFETLNLHRLEANIQPGNLPSIKLVKGAGFSKEGYSSNYLNVGNQGWRDHERWAIINDGWQPARMDHE